MAALAVLRWSIHSRNACLALERLVGWLYPHWPIWRRLWPVLNKPKKPEPIEDDDG